MRARDVSLLARCMVLKPMTVEISIVELAAPTKPLPDFGVVGNNDRLVPP
jgi:hypothetical protein